MQTGADKMFWNLCFLPFLQRTRIHFVRFYDRMQNVPPPAVADTVIQNNVEEYAPPPTLRTCPSKLLLAFMAEGTNCSQL